jgi:hypothetical protein
MTENNSAVQIIVTQTLPLCLGVQNKSHTKAQRQGLNITQLNILAQLITFTFEKK